MNNSFFVFAQKEVVEILRTKRLFVLACVFLFFAFASPMLARFMMEFLVMLMPADEMAMFIEIPPPAWQDSYMQFYGNMSQIGVITVILLFMGIVLDEQRKGTAALMMMKGLTHTGFIMAKFAVISISAFVVLLISGLIAHLYTIILFGEAADIGRMLLGMLVFMPSVLFMLAVQIFFSTVAKSTAMSAIFGFLALMFVGILPTIPRIGEFTPGVLMFAWPLEVTLGIYNVNLWLAMGIAVALTTLFLVLSINILRKKEM